ncbi:MAG: DUF4402 domain-containing protein [Sphingobacteriaceae bacterium]|nr:MAG: DUF4402 domain-containing protein [Sphingobacteriaceae bacterium]
MKKTKIFGAAVAMLFCAANANAQATATANVSATIVSPISISKTTDLSFGNLSVDATGGTVILDPSAAATRTNAGAGGITFPANTGTVSAASFVVSGQANFAYAINVLSTSMQITNGTDNMTVDNFTKSVTSGLLNNLGTQTVYVGADLQVSASQAPGIYTSSSPFTVLVSYN